MYYSASKTAAGFFLLFFFWAMALVPGKAEENKGCGDYRGKEGVFVAAKDPKPAGDGAFTSESGQLIRLSQLKGRALLVNFWTSWCPPCIREMPSMDRLQARFSADELTILPLTRDPGGTHAAAKFYQKHGLNNLPIAADRWGKIAFANRIGSTYPRTMFIDKKGREVGRLVGGADWEDPKFVKLLSNCLGVEETK